MTFDRDINQTRVKNSSFAVQDCSVQTLSIYLNFFCLKEHLRMQGTTESFLKCLIFWRRKRIISSMTLKTRQKWVSSRDVRDRDQKKNFTGTSTGTKKNYRDHDRDRDRRLNPRLYDGLNSVNFCASEVTLFKKKEPKSASRRLNKFKKRVLKKFLDEILNYRSAGPGPKEKF